MGCIYWSGNHVPQVTSPTSCRIVVRCIVGQITPFLIWTYRIGFPFLLVITYIRYILGSTLNLISASTTSSNMITSLSVSVWRYDSSLSNVATSWPSCVSTAAVINNNSVAAVGESISSFFIASHCFLPSPHTRTCIYTFRFLFRKIKYATSYTLCFLVSLIASNDAKISRTCSCISYFMTAALPSSLKLLGNVFSEYCVMIICGMWYSLYYLVMSMLRWTCPLLWVLPDRMGISLVNCFMSLVGYPL